jgi:hypothetical protein
MISSEDFVLPTSPDETHGAVVSVRRMAGKKRENQIKSNRTEECPAGGTYPERVRQRKRKAKQIESSKLMLGSTIQCPVYR